MNILSPKSAWRKLTMKSGRSSNHIYQPPLILHGAPNNLLSCVTSFLNIITIKSRKPSGIQMNISKNRTVVSEMFPSSLNSLDHILCIALEKHRSEAHPMGIAVLLELQSVQLHVGLYNHSCVRPCQPSPSLMTCYLVVPMI